MSKNSKSKDNSPARMKRNDYEEELEKLQVKLCHLQQWVKQKGLRVIIAFEGRDTAGKGRNNQGYHRAREPKGVPNRRSAVSNGAAKDANVSTTLH